MPPQIEALGALVTLKLAHNKLTVLPAELWTLKSLKLLDISANKVSALAGVGQLSCLVELRADKNNLTALPVSLFSLWVVPASFFSNSYPPPFLVITPTCLLF